MSAACKHQPSRLSEGITIRCLKFGTGRGSNAITAALWTRSTLERALSLRLCSCPQEIYSLDQYVSHPTHASRSPGSHGSHPGGTGRPSRRKLTLHRQSPSSPEVSGPCSHQNASVARASAQYPAQAPQRRLVHQSVSRHVLSVVRSFSHVALVRIGRAENSTHAEESDNFAHPTLGTRRSAISNPVQGLESSPWAEMPVRPSRLRPRASQSPKDHMGKLLQ